MKLFTRYNRLNLIPMIAVFLLSSFVYYFLMKYILIHELDEDLYEKQQKIEKYISINGSLPDYKDLDDVEISFTASGETDIKPHLKLVEKFDPEEHRKHSFRELIYSQLLGKVNYTVSITKPVEGTNTLLRIIVAITIATIFIIIIISVILNRVLLKKLWRPFYDTIKAVQVFKVSRKSELDFPETDIDEFAFLKNNLKDTIYKAQNEYYLLKEFTENASHEFQTPLAIIRSKLDLLIQEEDLSERQSELIKHTYSAITKLSRLNQSLLLLTKIENNQFPVTEVVQLKEKMEEKLQQFQELWQNNNIKVSAELGYCTICANPELIDILLNNLLSNASKHNIAGGSIDILLSAKMLVIKNTGSLKELDSARIFRRFYKEEQHNHSNGLGLSLIKEICENIGIQVNYSFAAHEHAFVLVFPESKIDVI